MDGRKQQFPFRKRANPQFKRNGGDKKGKWHDSNREYDAANSDSVDTVYRILCPSGKIGGVIGKGGSIVKALREETQAKITVAESVPGSDERVIIIYSSPNKIPKKEQSNERPASENEEEAMEPNCAAQDALMKVHDRIIEDDLFGGVKDNESNSITVRLLVSNNTVGCILGKGGDVIRKLRSETGASIRVLPEEHLPSCAMDTDELVQISGTPIIVRKALFVVSTLLHQNPRKDKHPLSFQIPFRGQDFPPNGPMWSHQNSSPHGMSPMPWRGGYRDAPSGFMPGGFEGAPPEQGGDAAGEFSMKILCSAGKIGGVIGKAGFNVKQLQHETGANIHVEDAATESDERVIRVSAFEALWNPRSQTIDAILELQNITGEYEKGKITTRLLVPSSKVGCLLGQGGHVINEMRRRTQADIRIYSKNDKPKCASEDEELVQISAIFEIAKDALAEIASRLRSRTLRDADAGEKPPVGPPHGYGPGGNMPRRGQQASGPIGAGSSGRYEPFEGVHREYEPQRYPLAPIGTRYPNSNIPMERKFPNDAAGSFFESGRRNMPGEVTGTRIKLQDSLAGGSECVVDIHGSSQHLSAAQNYTAPTRQNINYQPSSYQNNGQQVSYENMNAQQESYQGLNPQHGSYQGTNAHQGSYQPTSSQQGSYQGLKSQEDPYQGSYQATNSQQDPYQPSYQGMNSQQDPYQGSYQGLSSQQNVTPQQSTYDAHGSYQSTNAQQGLYPSANSQQGLYPSANAQQGSYPSANAQQGSYPSTYDQQGSYQSAYDQQGSYQNANPQEGSYQATIPQQSPYKVMDAAQQGSYQSSIMPQ